MSGCCCETCKKVEYLQRAAEENGDGIIFDVLGYPAITLQVFGDLSGGSDVEVQFLSGTDWLPIAVENVSTGVVTDTGIITEEGTYRVNTTGLQKIKAEVTGYAGTDSINVVATAVCEGSGTVNVSGEVTVTGEVTIPEPLETIPSPGTAVNTPAIVTAAGDAIAANANRKLWAVQNLGTNPLFVRLATGASSAVFHTVLKGGTVADDGNGGFISDEIHKGVVSVAGTSPRFTVTEIT